MLTRKEKEKRKMKLSPPPIQTNNFISNLKIQFNYHDIPFSLGVVVGSLN